MTIGLSLLNDQYSNPRSKVESSDQELIVCQISVDTFQDGFLVKPKYFLMNPADRSTAEKHCDCRKRIDSSIDQHAPEEESLK